MRRLSAILAPLTALIPAAALAAEAPALTPARESAYMLGVRCTALFDNLQRRTPMGTPQAGQLIAASTIWRDSSLAIDPDEDRFMAKYDFEDRAIVEAMMYAEQTRDTGEITTRYNECNRQPPPVPDK